MDVAMRKLIGVLAGCLVFLGAGAVVVGEEKVLARVGEGVITIEEFLILAPMVTSISPQGDVEAGKKKLLEALINQPCMLTRRFASASVRVPKRRRSSDKPERTS
jgi:hypothetical protein